jgi:hypothetical protein
MSARIRPPQITRVWFKSALFQVDQQRGDGLIGFLALERQLVDLVVVFARAMPVLAWFILILLRRNEVQAATSISWQR